MTSHFNFNILSPSTIWGLDWVITKWFIIYFHLRTPFIGEKCPFVGKNLCFSQLGQNKICAFLGWARTILVLFLVGMEQNLSFSQSGWNIITETRILSAAISHRQYRTLLPLDMID